MFRISSILLATIYVAFTSFFNNVISMTLPESSVSSLIIVIAIYLLIMWGYINFSFTSFSDAIDCSQSQINKALTLIVFSLVGVVVLMLSYTMTRSVENFPELAYVFNIFMIFILNYKTTIYRQYKLLNDTRKEAGLKSM